MRKMIVLLIGISFIAGLAYLVTGCGQAVPSIKTEVTTTPQPTGLTIRGTVYELNSGAGRTNPLSGVILVLSGGQVQASGVSAQSASTTYVATTDANGEYAFTNLPANSTGNSSMGPFAGYNVVSTKEGYQKTFTNGLNFGSFLTAPISDNSVLTQDINMSTRPVVLSISPAPGTTIESGSKTFTVVFNEAMDTTSVRPRIGAMGVRAFAVADNQNVTTAWSSDLKTLTITAVLSPNLVYALDVDNGTTAKDSAGNLLDTAGGGAMGGGTAGEGLNSASYNILTGGTVRGYYRVASGGVPGAPSGLTIGTSGGPFSSTGVDYGGTTGVYVGRAATTVDFAWAPSTSGNVSGYRIYVSRAAAGPWHLLTTTQANNSVASTVNAIGNTLFDTSAATTIDAVATRNFPFVNERIYARVVAFNGEGESTTVETSAIELNPPGLSTTAYSGRTGGAGFAAGSSRQSDGYYVAPLTAGTETTTAYIAFDEPIDPSTITTGNFTISGGKTVTGATLLTSNSTDLDPAAVWGGSVYSIVRITSGAAFAAADTITAGTGIKDLAGNAAAAATTVVIP